MELSHSSSVKNVFLRLRLPLLGKILSYALPNGADKLHNALLMLNITVPTTSTSLPPYLSANRPGHHLYHT